MTTSSKRAYAIPRSAVPRALSLQQSTADRTSSRKRNTKKAKWLSEAALQIAEEEEKLKAKKKRKHTSI